MCRLCRYLSLPLARPPIAKVKRDARGRKGKRGEARESEGKRGKATQPSCDEHNPRGTEGRKKVKSEEGRGKNQIANKLID